MRNRLTSIVVRGLATSAARLAPMKRKPSHFTGLGIRTHCSLLALLTILVPRPVSATDSATVANLTGKSGYIFQGTVKKLHAATPTVPLESTTAIVLVNRVLDGTKEIGDLKGKEVTVRLLPEDRVQSGMSLVFFTYGYSFGKSVGLAEVGALPGTETEALSAQVREARQVSADQALQSRLETSVLVVLATAGEPQPTEEIKLPNIDEHDPLWWMAPLKVEKVVKGKLTSEALSVLFARNVDYRWFNAPKIHAGQHAIYLLHPDQDREHGMKGYFVVDKSDVVPAEDLDRVERLLKTKK
jgi:hypothetical protein